jgi:hypothetical protein
VEKGWPKSQKCQRGKEARGKEARGKEPLSRHGTVGKYVGERIGGYLGVPRDGSQRRTSIGEWDQLTLKKGSVGGGEAENKSERTNNTGQVRGVCHTGRQRQSCSCAGTQTKKKRRLDCPKRVDGSRFAGRSETACIGRAKEGKY